MTYPKSCICNFILLLLIFQGCQSVTLDLRSINEPIVLNKNPFCKESPNAFKSKEIDTFVNRVSKAYAGAGYSSSSKYSTGVFTTTTTYSKSAYLDSLKNNAQKEAFYAIGEHKNRCIRNIEIEANSISVFFVIVFGSETSIKIVGDVVEYNFDHDSTSAIKSSENIKAIQ